MIVTRNDIMIAWDHTEPTVQFAVGVDGETIAVDLSVREHAIVLVDGVHQIEVYAYWDSGDETKWSSPATLEVGVHTVAPDPPTNLRVVA